MSKKTYIVESYDPATRKIERVTVTHEVYNAYRRSGWNLSLIHISEPTRRS